MANVLQTFQNVFSWMIFFYEQHWSRLWFNAIRQKAITWINVDQDLWLGLNHICNRTDTYHKSYQQIMKNSLTLKHRETHGCVVSTVATDALVLKHQTISIHNADYTFIGLDQFHMKILHIRWTASENEITFWKKWPSRLRVKRKHV